MSGVRTRAGRAQSYRGVWQAMLRSPARAAATTVVLVVLVVVAGQLLGSHQHKAPPRPGPGAAGAPTVGAPAPAAPAAPRPTVDPATAQVAKVWAARWLAHGDGAAAAAPWRESLAPLTTPEYLGLLSSVDIGQVPTGKVTGPIRLAATPGGSSAIALVPTSADGLVLRLTLVEGPERRWQVSYAEPAS